MRARYSMIPLVAVAALSLRSTPVSAQAPKLNWGPAPAVFPAGAKMAVLQGDPHKAEMFTIRLDMPNGYTIAPHFHPTDEHITVISGTFRVGMGDKVAAGHTMTLPAGAFVTAAANEHHYATAKGRTVVQVHAMGPFALTYVNEADDPSRKGRVTGR